jgi:GNAT superfamily N-acetyltransferase
VSPNEFVSRHREQYPDVVLTLRPVTGNTIVLENLVVPSPKRRKGLGSDVMRRLTEAADQENWILLLTPDSVYGIPRHKLELFYRKFGFVKNSSAVSTETMLRSPQGLTERVEAAKQSSRNG